MSFILLKDRGRKPEETANHYGIIDNKGVVKCRTEFRCGPGAPPAFLHDCFVTKDWSICIDHSLQADDTKLASTGYFEWDTSRNVRLDLPA